MTAYTWTNLASNAFRAMIGHAATLRIIEPSVDNLIVDTAARQDRKSTRLNSSHEFVSRMPSSA